MSAPTDPDIRVTGGAHAASPRRRRPSVLTIVGIGLLVVGLSILGWIGYQFWGTNIVARHQTATGTQQLRDSWSKDAAKPVAPAKLTVRAGAPFALMRIPRLGASWQYPVLAGTDAAQLSRGIGWYTQTAKPGAIGNFAVAAHRITHGEPFRHLLEVRTGDSVIVETADHVYTYVIDDPATDLTVQDTAGWVLDPVPGHANQKATRALITLTTCAELFHAPTRSVAFGHLVSARTK